MREQKRPLRKKYAPQRISRLPAKRTQPTAAQSSLGAVPERTLVEQSADHPEQAADQERRRAVLAGLFAKAQALVPDPPDSPTRKACRASSVDEVIVEKFRRQGFHL
jgi:hypothetical protein